MMKKAQRFGKFVVLVALPLVILFTLLNVVLLTNHEHRDTTFILKEKVVQKGSGTSSSDLDRLFHRQPADNAHAHVQGPEGTDDIVKKSGPGDAESRRDLVDQNGNLARSTMRLRDEAVDKMIQQLMKPTLTPFFPSYFWNDTMYQLTSRLGSVAKKNAKTLEGYNNLKTYPKIPGQDLPTWKKVHRNIRQFSLYDRDDKNVDQLLQDMISMSLKESDENDGGTQLKINVRLEDGGRAVMKPMRYGREVEADENRYIFDDMERHIAEIAAFQLDRLLGFYRVPPTVGRLVNITSELKPIVPEAIYKTFFTSPAGNICFFGKCDYFCESAFAFCGHPDMLEVSMMSYLPSRNIALRKSWYQPWRRAYSKWRKAYWEKNDDLCEQIRDTQPFNNGKLLLDMIDVHTFDFLTGNKDRHSFATFKEWGNYTFPIVYDNGRGFGRQTYDAMSILAPLRQCCVIRKSTLLKYVKLYTGSERLSDLMEEALSRDPLAPVLIGGHLNALDRRLVKILNAVATCLQTKPVKDVVISDRF